VTKKDCLQTLTNLALPHRRKIPWKSFWNFVVSVEILPQIEAPFESNLSDQIIWACLTIGNGRNADKISPESPIAQHKKWMLQLRLIFFPRSQPYKRYFTRKNTKSIYIYLAIQWNSVITNSVITNTRL